MVTIWSVKMRFIEIPKRFPLIWFWNGYRVSCAREIATLGRCTSQVTSATFCSNRPLFFYSKPKFDGSRSVLQNISLTSIIISTPELKSWTYHRLNDICFNFLIFDFKAKKTRRLKKKSMAIDCENPLIR